MLLLLIIVSFLPFDFLSGDGEHHLQTNLHRWVSHTHVNTLTWTHHHHSWHFSPPASSLPQRPEPCLALSTTQGRSSWPRWPRDRRPTWPSETPALKVRPLCVPVGEAGSITSRTGRKQQKFYISCVWGSFKTHATHIYRVLKPQIKIIREPRMNRLPSRVFLNDGASGREPNVPIRGRQITFKRGGGTYRWTRKPTAWRKPNNQNVLKGSGRFFEIRVSVKSLVLFLALPQIQVIQVMFLSTISR